MIKRTFEITARIEQGQIPFCFQCVQNDKDVYMLRIRITDGDKEIDYTQVSSATITFALANGAVVQSDPTRLTVSATGIIYQMGTSEIACPGKVLASIQLFGSSGERLTTARFRFEVVADLITPGAVQSESHFPLLQQLVADVEQLKQDIVDTQIPDGSIMDVKLSNAAGQIKQRFAAHKAENVSHLIELIRDVSISGVQTISSLPFKPKSLICIASIELKKAFSIGFWAENNAQFVKSIRLDMPEAFKSAKIVYLRNTSGYILAEIQNVTETGFEINWGVSTGITGTATLFILASTH